MTQNMVQSSVSTLEYSLNDEIQRVNARRKEDVVTTKAVLADPNKSLTKRMDSQFAIVQSLHESNLHLEENLTLLMNKVGITHMGERHGKYNTGYKKKWEGGMTKW